MERLRFSRKAQNVPTVNTDFMEVSRLKSDPEEVPEERNPKKSSSGDQPSQYMISGIWSAAGEKWLDLNNKICCTRVMN